MKKFLTVLLLSSMSMMVVCSSSAPRTPTGSAPVFPTAKELDARSKVKRDAEKREGYVATYGAPTAPFVVAPVATVAPAPVFPALSATATRLFTGAAKRSRIE